MSGVWGGSGAAARALARRLVFMLAAAARVSAASPLRGVALSLLARPGARLRFGGAPGRTRRGELSCFAAEAALLELPPEPAACYPRPMTT